MADASTDRGVPASIRNARFDVTGPVVPARELGRVHLLAIGGAGMSAVARLLLAAGLEVSGSDAKDSPVLRALGDEGAVVHVGHDAAYLSGVDTVVVSSAVRDDNVELVAARARGLRVLHRSQALASVAAGFRAVAVAGANGKTTTSAMTAVALDAAGLDPSFAIGSDVPPWDVNARLGEGEPFVVEADESDGSFLAYRPEVAVVTNVQPDHLDFYGTFEQVRAAYAAFARSRASGGLLVACHDDPGSLALAAEDRGSGRRVLTYGVDAGADVRLEEVLPAYRTPDGFGARARIVGTDAVSRELVLSVPGHHNLLDAAAAYAASVEGFGAGPADVLEGLRAFTGARRRFEVAGTARGVTVVDDYAHNVGKVTALVASAIELVGRDHVRVVFQPHLFSRTRDFAEGFGAALAQVDDVVLLPVYGAREEPLPGVTSALIGDVVTRLNPQALVEVEADAATVPLSVADRAVSGDLVLVVGAGDVTRLAPQVVDALRRTS